MTRVIRGIGWTLIMFGAEILLYIVYLLFFTNLQTAQAQTNLADRWLNTSGAPEEALPGEFDPDAEPPPVEPVTPGDAYAVMWFERPGQTERPVHKEALYVVEGVTLDLLRRGPGHYPRAAGPGEPGNFAVSGHRTTYGAPFYHLDQLRAGDEIHVIDRDQREWVYAVTEQRIVAPTDVWVVEPDPLGTGRPMMTLTTCHPKFSAAQRLIVFADLVTEPVVA